MHFWIGSCPQHQVPIIIGSDVSEDEDGRGCLPLETATESEVSSDGGCFLSEEVGLASDDGGYFLSESSSEDDAPHLGKSSFPVEVGRGQKTAMGVLIFLGPPCGSFLLVWWLAPSRYLARGLYRVLEVFTLCI